MDLAANRAGSSSGGWGGLARRISGRTTDLLAIGLLAAALLTFGRQLTQWWRETPPTVAGPDTGVLEFRDLRRGGAPAWFEFGELPVGWRQQSTRGSADEARGALRAGLARLASASAGRVPGRPPQAGERRLLELLAGQPGPGQELFPGHEWLPLEGPLSGGVIVRLGPGDEWGARRRAGRVVAWGLQVPGGSDHWNLHLFGESVGVRGERSEAGLDLPGGRRVMVVGDDAGGELQLWRGQGELDDWQEVITRWLEQGGWQREGTWQRGTSGRRGLYRRRVLAGREGGPEFAPGKTPPQTGPTQVEISLLNTPEEPTQLTAWFQFGESGR